MTTLGDRNNVASEQPRLTQWRNYRSRKESVPESSVKILLNANIGLEHGVL